VRKEIARTGAERSARQAIGLLLRLLALVLVVCVLDVAAAEGAMYEDLFLQQVDSPQIDLPYPIVDPPNPGDQNTGTIDLQNPANIQNDVVYDPATGQYILRSPWARMASTTARP
jgi:hypothetical protein